MNDVLTFVRAAVGRSRDATDADLLSAFVERRDEAAFEGLLRRHGSAVLGACRRVLGAGPDADDAFQATFLVLARKAGAIRPRATVGGWLYGVAIRASLKVRTSAARRRAREREVANMPTRPDDATERRESVEALQREIGRLPDELRTAVVLCELEGKTRIAVARQLGWPEGTVASRLARAKRILARRLKSTGPLLFAPLAPVMVSNKLRAKTLEVVLSASADVRLGAGLIAEEVLSEMLLTKLSKFSAACVAVLVAGAIGLGLQSTPTAAAPAAKGTTSSGDLASVLKTVRPISVSLLNQPEVLADLKCTEDQKDALNKLIKGAREAHQEKIKAMFQGGPGGGVFQIAGGQIPSLKYETDKIAAVLKPEQLIRVRQFELHLQGPKAFADRRVIRALGLTVDQELKIEEAIIRYESALNEAVQTMYSTGREPDAKPLATVGEKFVADCRKVLSKDQDAAWNWMLGARLAPGPWARTIVNHGDDEGFSVAVGGFAGPAIALPLAPAIAVPGVAVALPLPPAAPEKKEDKKKE